MKKQRRFARHLHKFLLLTNQNRGTLQILHLGARAGFIQIGELANAESPLSDSPTFFFHRPVSARVNSKTGKTRDPPRCLCLEGQALKAFLQLGQLQIVPDSFHRPWANAPGASQRELLQKSQMPRAAECRVSETQPLQSYSYGCPGPRKRTPPILIGAKNAPNRVYWRVIGLL